MIISRPNMLQIEDSFSSPVEENKMEAVFDFDGETSSYQQNEESLNSQQNITRSCRRERTKFTPFQKAKLEECFARQPHPDYDQRQELVQMLGLKDGVLQVWFKNRRSKERKKKCQSSCNSVQMPDWSYRSPFPVFQQSCYPTYNNSPAAAHHPSYQVSPSSFLSHQHNYSHMYGYTSSHAAAYHQSTFSRCSPQPRTGAWSGGIPLPDSSYKVMASSPINYSVNAQQNIKPDSPEPTRALSFGQYLNVPPMFHPNPCSPFVSMDRRLSPRLSPLEYVYDPASSSKDLTNSTPSASGFELMPSNQSGYYSENCDRSLEAPVFNMSA